MIDENAIRQRWEAVGSKLDERGRRLFAAGEARSAGWGGLAALSKITGLARSTINRGKLRLVRQLRGESVPANGRPADQMPWPGWVLQPSGSAARRPSRCWQNVAKAGSGRRNALTGLAEVPRARAKLETKMAESSYLRSPPLREMGRPLSPPPNPERQRTIHLRPKSQR